MSALDDKVRRSLRVMFATHVFDTRKPGALNTPAHQKTALRIAEESLVLLKNERQVLPLDLTKSKAIAVIGENAVRHHATGLWGAGVKTMHEITPLEGIVQRAGGKANITYSTGYSKEGGASLVERAVTAARQSDVAIIFAGLSHSRYQDDEGWDRASLRLPYGQDELIQKVAQANPRTIVVLVGGPALQLDAWLPQVPALLQVWYPGMEGGTAIARALFGDVDPSGKLTCTYPKKIEDSPAHALGTYPGTNGTLFYKEGLLVGYRWFDTRGIEPLFPFGYGLSYTRFEYSGLRLAVEPEANFPERVVTVELEVANVGERGGSEVVEVYVHQNHPSVMRPVKELKAFGKVFLKPGERKKLSLPLDQRAFAYYAPSRGGWVAEKDTYEVQVGSSSRDIRLQEQFELPREGFRKQ